MKAHDTGHNLLIRAAEPEQEVSAGGIPCKTTSPHGKTSRALMLSLDLMKAALSGRQNIIA